MAEHIIETERLLIRRFSLGDAAEFLPLVVLPEVLRYTGEQALTSTSEVIDLLTERQLRDYRVHGYGRMACLEKASGRLIGFSGLKYLDDLDETDLGTGFFRRHEARAMRPRAHPPSWMSSRPRSASLV